MSLDSFIRVVVMLGPPGAGKGTVAVRLANVSDYAHLSSGDLLRNEVAAANELGQALSGYMARGELVPDALVAKLVGQKIRAASGGGILLDGFPRTVAQVKILDAEIEACGARLQSAVLLEVPEDVLLDRLTGRRVCSDCAAVYHVRTLPPRSEGRCDHCGGTLQRRTDDGEETVRNRLAVYDRQTQPLLRTYEQRGLLIRVDGVGPLEEILARVRRALAETGPPSIATETAMQA